MSRSAFARPLLAVAAGLTLVGAPARAAAAQEASAVLTGVVRDESGARLAGADVGFLNLRLLSRTDSAGSFRFSLPAGMHLLRVRQPGYRILRAPVEVIANDSMAIEVVLEIAPQPLPAVSVEAEARRTGPLGEFDRRRAGGFGRFVTREEIDRRHATSVAELLRSAGGLLLVTNEHGELVIPSLRASVAGERCVPTVFVDGMRFPIAGRALDVFPAEHVEGIEIYRTAAEVPPSFGAGDTCGVIAIWTRVD